MSQFFVAYPLGDVGLPACRNVECCPVFDQRDHGTCVWCNLFLVKLGRRTHVDELVVTRCVVGDFLNKVNLRIIEQLIKFIQDDGFHIHHLDFFQFNNSKIRPGVPIRILVPFQTLNLAFLTGT